MANPMPFTPCDMSGGGSTCPDVSVGILQSIFGQVIDRLAVGADPETVTAASNLIASIMTVFNSGLLVIASLIVSYIAAMGVTNTAADGESMGKSWSSLWTPVRIVAGGATLLPSASGYSFIQIIVMMISLWGIGFANGIYRIAVENGLVNGSLTSVSSQLGMGTAAKPNPDFPLYDMRKFATDYLAVAWCARTVNLIYASSSAAPQVKTRADGQPDSIIKESATKTAMVFNLKDQNPESNLAGGAALCGSVKFYQYSAPAALSVTPAVGSIFDPATINSNAAAMQALRTAALNAKRSASITLMQDLDNWVNEWPSDINQTGWENVKSDRLNTILNQAQSTLSADLQAQITGDTTLKDIMSKYVTDVTKDGWSMAGGFYQRLGGIREEMSKIYAEPAAQATQPTLTSLPSDARAVLAQNSLQTVYRTVITKAMDGGSYQSSGQPRPSDLVTLIPNSLDDLNIDTLGSRGDSYMSSFIGWSMRRTTEIMIGTDGDVDALARIKTTGDTLALIQSMAFLTDRALDTGVNLLRGAAALVGSVEVLGNKIDLKPAGDVLRDWIHHNIIPQLVEVATWTGRLAFYFGVFLPSLPYTIFMIAVVGWILAVFQSIVAAPLWAVMHMTPDRTFIGSQSQGYLLLLSLFVRPALIVIGLFAALLIANPVIGYIAKAFWAMRTANVTSSESLGWFIEFLTWKNWMMMYGFVLLPVTYMIFGLSQALPDSVLRWIGAGISDLGETNAGNEMRRGVEGAGNRIGPSGGGKPAVGGGAKDKLPTPDSGGGAGLSSGGGSRGGGSGGTQQPRLLNANGQGVAPTHDSGSGPSQASNSSSTSTAQASNHGHSASLNSGPQGAISSRGGDIADAKVKEHSQSSRSGVLALGVAAAIGAASENATNDSPPSSRESSSSEQATINTGAANSIADAGSEGVPDKAYDSRYTPPPATETLAGKDNDTPAAHERDGSGPDPLV